MRTLQLGGLRVVSTGSYVWAAVVVLARAAAFQIPPRQGKLQRKSPQASLPRSEIGSLRLPDPRSVRMYANIYIYIYIPWRQYVGTRRRQLKVPNMIYYMMLTAISPATQMFFWHGLPHLQTPPRQRNLQQASPCSAGLRLAAARSTELVGVAGADAGEQTKRGC